MSPTELTGLRAKISSSRTVLARGTAAAGRTRHLLVRVSPHTEDVPTTTATPSPSDADFESGTHQLSSKHYVQHRGLSRSTRDCPISMIRTLLRATRFSGRSNKNGASQAGVCNRNSHDRMRREREGKPIDNRSCIVTRQQRTSTSPELALIRWRFTWCVGDEPRYHKYFRKPAGASNVYGNAIGWDVCGFNEEEPDRNHQ